MYMQLFFLFSPAVLLPSYYWQLSFNYVLPYFVQELALKGYSGAGRMPLSLLHRLNVLTK